MASRGNQIEPRRPAPRIYLVTPPVADPAGLKNALASTLEAGDVAAVLVQLTATDDRTMINRVKVLAPIVQGKGVALLVDGHPEIVPNQDETLHVLAVALPKGFDQLGVRPVRAGVQPLFELIQH